MKIEQFNQKLRADTIKYFSCEPVMGDGPQDADIVLIGEAPGANEVKLGRPFVGAAGKNLQKYLDISSLKREDIYITNVVKIRPVKPSPKTGKPVNRPPDKRELDFFVSYLFDELEIIAPKTVITLGNFSLKKIYGDEKAVIGELHGKPIKKDKYILFPMYHPASIIYNRSLEDTFKKDWEKLKETLIGGK